METQQAHSTFVGRDAALRRPRTARRAVPTPLVWLNLVCLDAPLVALAWLWLFARTFHVTLAGANCATLFLTAWMIYLADRLADALALPGQIHLSLRGEFCRRHRRPWGWTLAVIAIVDAGLIWRSIDARTFLIGAFVGAAALIYLVLNHSLGRIWRFLPVKEAAIGFLFAAGTLVGLLPGFPPIDSAFVLSALAFGFLCALNCVSIAVWERELDVAQEKISIATRYPSVQRHLAKFVLALALASFVGAIFYRQTSWLFGCVSASALVLALLDFVGGVIDQDQRTALADLVLLTPLVVLIGAGA